MMQKLLAVTAAIAAHANAVEKAGINETIGGPGASNPEDCSMFCFDEFNTANFDSCSCDAKEWLECHPANHNPNDGACDQWRVDSMMGRIPASNPNIGEAWYNSGDGQTKPICGLPEDGDRVVDHGQPDKDCCRIYELSGFFGVYMNMCSVDFLGNIIDLTLIKGARNEQGVNTWDNEISSWKCGDRVSIKLCYNNDDDCDDPNMYESGHHGSGNARMGSNDEVSRVMISVPELEKNPQYAVATFFEGVDCEGHSLMLQSEADGSFTKEQIDHPIFNGGALQSVLLDGTVDVNFEIKADLETHDLKLSSTTPMTCINVGHFEHLADIKTIKISKQEEIFVPPNSTDSNNLARNCSFNDQENLMGANRCQKDSECSGDRTCSDWFFCDGNSNCPDLSV